MVTLGDISWMLQTKVSEIIPPTIHVSIFFFQIYIQITHLLVIIGRKSTNTLVSGILDKDEQQYFESCKQLVETIKV